MRNFWFEPKITFTFKKISKLSCLRMSISYYLFNCFLNWSFLRGWNSETFDQSIESSILLKSSNGLFDWKLKMKLKGSMFRFLKNGCTIQNWSTCLCLWQVNLDLESSSVILNTKIPPSWVWFFLKYRKSEGKIMKSCRSQYGPENFCQSHVRTDNIFRSPRVLKSRYWFSFSFTLPYSSSPNAIPT